MSYLPLITGIASTAGSIYQKISERNASSFNSQVLGQERNLSVNQATAQENQVRRFGRERLGMQEAAFGGAGVGYGGSSYNATRQTAINEEIDALNSRYKGRITGYGYGIESKLENQQSNQSNLLAGAALLKGIGTAYTDYKFIDAGQSVVVPPNG